MSSAMELLACDDPQEHAGVMRTLRRFGEEALHFAYARGTRIVLLDRGQAYASRSEALARLGIDVDAWPAPPAGLFVVEERTVYLRSRSPMTVAHEFGHALDCALGKGVYLSSTDETLRGLYSQAKAYVTPYAATAPDEYFAECLRAYVEVNDAQSFWPRATRARLRRIDPAMYAFVGHLFLRGFAERVSGTPPSRNNTMSAQRGNEDEDHHRIDQRLRADV